MPNEPTPQRPLYVERGGSAGPVLLLIHGLSANGAVWDRLLPLVQRDWPGRYLVPDLRGHGASAHVPPYAFGTFASDLAGLIEPGQEVAIIGHSLGGVLGALLATGWFGVNVRMVLALSVKTVWSAEELQKFGSVGDQPVRWMDSRADAQARFIKASGLSGVVEPTDRIVSRGLTEHDGRFRFAADQKVYGSTAGNVEGLLRAARCPVHFATGANDAMAPVDQHLPYDPQAVTFAGAGHQVQLERPEEVWALFQQRWSQA